MCIDNKFLFCAHCGNIVGKIYDSGVKIVCCGEEMQELVANTVDASREKHLPVVSVVDNEVTVTIGSVFHPMIAEHYISWVYLELESGGQRKCLVIGNDPVVKFALAPNDKLLSVYAYCNIHGLWQTKI